MSKIHFWAIPFFRMGPGQDFKEISLLFNLVPFHQKIWLNFELVEPIVAMLRLFSQLALQVEGISIRML
jgi:hypothetical protein